MGVTCADSFLLLLLLASRPEHEQEQDSVAAEGRAMPYVLHS